MLRRFWSADSAATAIEYALVAGFISLSIIAGARVIGNTLSTKYFAPVAANLS